ncbi:MAG: GNAT family N-acetyltransferase [Chitinophagaceae bacterium]
MAKTIISNIEIRKLGGYEIIPYELLLLADPDQQVIDKYIDDSEIYVTELENKIIGVYVLYSPDQHTVEIKNIAVEEKYQGRGIGKMMIDDAMQVSKNKNYTTLLVGTGNSSISQLAFYQKQGFEIFDIKKNFFVDNYSEPIIEDGIACKHMIMLTKKL